MSKNELCIEKISALRAPAAKEKKTENDLCIEHISALRVPSLKNLDYVKISGAVLRKMSTFNHRKWVCRDATTV